MKKPKINSSILKLGVVGTVITIAGGIGYDKGVEMFEKTFPKFIDKISLMRAAINISNESNEDDL